MNRPLSGAPTSWLKVGVVFVLLAAVYWAAPASALEAEQQAYFEATDALLKVAGELESARVRYSAHQQRRAKSPALGSDPAWRAEDRRLRTLVAKLRSRVSRAKAVQRRALSALQKALEPYTKIRREALTSIAAVKAASGLEVNKQRAAATIRRDLEKLNGPVVNRYLQAIKTTQDMIRSGRPHEFVKEQILNLFKDLPSGKIFAEAFIDTVNDVFKEEVLNTSERLKMLEDHLGAAAKLAKALNILNGGTETPFGDEDLNRVANIFDLALDFVPGDQEFAGLKAYALYQKAMIDSIIKSVEKISQSVASRNLKALVENSYSTSDLDTESKWLGLTPGQLFGDIDFSPPGEWFIKINPPPRTPSGEQFVVDDEVQITFGWKSDEASSAWLWVGLASNGDPASYRATAAKQRRDPEIVFAELPLKEAGRVAKYTRYRARRFGVMEARLYVDQPGVDAENAHAVPVGKAVRFEIHEPKWGVWTDRENYLAGDDVRSTYIASRLRTELAWAGVVPPSIAHGSGERNARSVLARKRVAANRGTLVFKAPAQPSKYDVRVNDGGGREVASASFYVVAKPEPKIDLDKTEVYEGEDVLLTYESSLGYPRSAFIGAFRASRHHFGLEETPRPQDVSPLSTYLGRAYRYVGGTEAGRVNLGPFFLRSREESAWVTVRMFDRHGGKQVAMAKFLVKRRPSAPGTVRATLRGESVTKRIR